MNLEQSLSKKDLADGLASVREEMASLEERLIQKLASKDELAEGLASLEKKLTEKLASKEELAALEKRLYAELASKKELAKTNDRLDRLTGIVLQNTDDIKSIKATMEKVVYNQDLFMEALTDLAGDIKDDRLERSVINATFIQHADQLRDHEQRIHTLEKKTA